MLRSGASGEYWCGCLLLGLLNFKKSKFYNLLVLVSVSAETEVTVVD